MFLFINLNKQNKKVFFLLDEIIIYMEIQELGTQDKNMYGSGLEHAIYASKSNPNVLFKVGHKDSVNEWFELFKKHPNLFPKVFRSGKLQDKDYYYVEIEKLDTGKFEDNWDMLEESLEDIGAVDPDEGESFSDLYLTNGSDAEIFKNIAIKLSKHNKDSYNFFIELLTLIKDCERAQNSFLNKDTIVDAHKYNFGYSSDGKIKCLDV
jgi:hypothetical protein